MSEFESLNDQQLDFERALQQLQPVVPSLDVANLMYRAGRDSAFLESRRQLRRWQFSTLCTGVCALIAATIHWPGNETGSVSDNSVATQDELSDAQATSDHPSPDTPLPQTEEISPSESIVKASPASNVDREVPSLAWWNSVSQVPEASNNSYITLRNRVMREGLDAFPEPEFSSESTFTGSPVQREPLRLRDAYDPELWNQI